MRTRRRVRTVFRVTTVITEFLLFYAGLRVILTDAGNPVPNLLFWNVVAFTYLGAGLIAVQIHLARLRPRASLRPPMPREPGTRESDPPMLRKLMEVYWGVLPLVLSVIGLTAVVTILFGESLDTTDADPTLIKIAASLVVISTWLMLHVSYARRYQWIMVREGGGLVFPQTAHPTVVDYLYFSFTLGSSFATSDVDVTTPTMRWHVLVHTVLSFFYNAIVLAVAFRIFTGG